MKKYVKSDIKTMLDNGRSLGEIGYVYGVSRQRIYQIITALGLQTLEKTRKRQSDTWTDAQKWLWKILTHRGNDLSKADKLTLFDKIRLPTRCPVLGIPLDYTPLKGTRSDNSPSLDRIDPAKGYVHGNVHVISWRANRIKNDATTQELRDIANFFAQLEK